MNALTRVVLALVFFGCCVTATPAKAQTFVETIVGNGALNGIAVDTANGGNILVADANNNRVDVFSATGTLIRTIGSGLGSENGQLNGPRGVAIDTANGNNVLVADLGNNRIEVFSATGTFIRTIGSGLGSGNGQLNSPWGVAVDTANGSNILVGDTNNDRIEVFSATGTFIGTIGSGPGSGNGQLNHPFGVAIDTANGSNVVVLDGNNNRVEVFSSAGTFIRKFGSAGSGNGQLNGAFDLAIDPVNASNVLVADRTNNRVEAFSATGTFIRTIGSTGSGNGQLSGPIGIAVDAGNGGNVVVGDLVNNRVEIFSPTGTFLQSIVAGVGQLNVTYGTAVDTVNGSNVLVADFSNNRIQVFTSNGQFVRAMGSTGSGNGQLTGPNGVAVDTANGSNVIVGDTGNDRVEVFSATGAFITTIGSGPGSGNGQFNTPNGVAVDTANGGNVLVADTNNNRIQVFSSTGTFIRTIGNGQGSGNGQLNGPRGVAVDTANGSNVVVVDNGNNRVEVFSATGTFIRKFGSFGSGNGQMNAPWGVAIDTPNNSNVVVGDTFNKRVEVFSATGAFIRTIGLGVGNGDGQLNGPYGVAVDTVNASDVIASDRNNNRLEVFTDLFPTATQSIASVGLTQNTAAASFTPVTGSGGNGSLSYSVAPALPTGLSMATATGAITGTPTVTSSTTSYTVTVTDADNMIATANFSLTVNSVVAATQVIASTSLELNFVASPFMPVTGSGGTTPLLYGVSPALPTGLSMAASTGTITGTPTVTSSFTSYTVTVTDANSATATATFLLSVVSAPTVSAVSPSSGPTAGGTSVTLTGTNLTGASAVSFGGTAATSFTVNSASQITAITPTGSAGTIDLTVITAGGTSATSSADHYTYIAAPTVTALSPSSGPTAGGTSVTLTGTNLTGASAVSFGGTAATSFTVNSASQITAITPAGSAGTIDLTITTAGGTSATSSADHYTYMAAPTVSAINPGTSPTAGGATIAITGTNLTGATAVSFGGTAAKSFTVNSASQITAITPAGSVGWVHVTISTPGGTSITSASDHCTYVASPTVSAISPSSGPVAGGTTVTLTGTNLTGASAVSFGGTAASSFTVNSASQITATAPAGAAGAVDVTITTAGGASAIGSADKFTYLRTITTTLTASLAPSTFGTPVTFTAMVTGSGGSPTGTVTFKDGPATLGTGSLTSQRASFSIAALTVGNHSITAVYGGDSNFPASTSAALTQTIQPDPNAIAGQAYTYQSTLGVTGSATTDNTHFSSPVPGAVDPVQGHLFVADAYNHRVQILDTASLNVVATIGVPGVSGRDNTHLYQPGGVAFDVATGRVFVADTGNQRIQIFDAKSFAYVATLGQSGVNGLDNGHFLLPVSVKLNPANGQLYIADLGNHRVQIFDAATLAYVATLGTAAIPGSDDTHFNQPRDAAFNPSTNQIMVADSANSRLQLFDADSFAHQGTLGGPDLPLDANSYIGTPVTVAFDPMSNLILIADASVDDRVQVLDALTYGYLLTLGTTGSPGTAPSQYQGPHGVAVDPAHARIFIGDGANDRVQVYSISPSPQVSAVLPDSRSVRIGTKATVFAMIINAGATDLAGCRIALAATAPAGLTLSYQTTAASTNALTGTPNTPAPIAAGANQTFVVTFADDAPVSAMAMPLDFACTGVAPAPISPGVNTIDLLYSTTPVPDVIALAATVSGDGILTVPFSRNQAAAFAVATDNLGIAGLITAETDFNGAALPLIVTICPTNPKTAACLAPPANSVTSTIEAGTTPTFAIFAQASAPIQFAPATARIFVRFKDAQGVEHGATSVAVRTD
jgi:DNA-binding beta-propeller fold protein YncE